uniref:Uncharacterized protein n=1 Tax=Sander lucioperca TaxID=283035 RepID=A0A8D0DDS3_SANLU
MPVLSVEPKHTQTLSHTQSHDCSAQARLCHSNKWLEFHVHPMLDNSLYSYK